VVAQTSAMFNLRVTRTSFRRNSSAAPAADL